MSEPAAHTMINGQQGLPQPQRNRAIVAIVLGLGMSILSGSMINLALPGMALDFGCSFSEIVWIVSAYQAAALGALLPCSALGDRLGYRQVYIVGVALFTVSAFFCALSDSLNVLIFMRILQGVGSAGVMGVNIALMRQIYPEFLLGRGIALNGLVVSICAISGPFIAAQLLTFGTWRWLFWLTLPIGGVLFFLAKNAFPVKDREAVSCSGGNTAIPLLDVILNVVVFGLFFLVVSYWRGHEQTVFQNGLMGVLVVVWCVLGYGYWRRQRNHSTPLLPVDLLRIREFLFPIGMAVAAYCAQNLFFLSLPFLMLSVWEMSETQTGLLIAVWPLATAMMSVPAGQMIGRFSNRFLSVVGLFVLALGLGAFLLLTQEPENHASIVWRMMLCGFGFCLFQTSNVHGIISAVPVQRSGAASGMMNVARLSGQILATIMVTLVFAGWHDLAAGVGVIQWMAFLLALGVALLGFVKRA